MIKMRRQLLLLILTILPLAVFAAAATQEMCSSLRWTPSLVSTYPAWI